MTRSRIISYHGIISGLPDRIWRREDLLIPELLIESYKDLELYYAPYDYVSPGTDHQKSSRTRSEWMPIAALLPSPAAITDWAGAMTEASPAA